VEEAWNQAAGFTILISPERHIFHSIVLNRDPQASISPVYFTAFSGEHSLSYPDCPSDLVVDPLNLMLPPAVSLSLQVVVGSSRIDGAPWWRSSADGERDRFTEVVFRQVSYAS